MPNDFVHARPVSPQETPDVGIAKPADEVTEAKDLNVDNDIPVTLYNQRFGKPYAVEFFGLSKEPHLSFDTNTMSKLEGIENFVLRELSERGLTDSKDSYHDYMNRFMDAAKIGRFEQTSTKINKLYTAMSVRVLQLDKPQSLKQLKKFFQK